MPAGPFGKIFSGPQLLMLPPAFCPPLFAPNYDIFCTVIDNYGDIGVCWRLARQLATERRQSVRLWVDDLQSFGRLCPDIDPALAQQNCRGVDVRKWSRDFPEVLPGNVVIEAFACELPESFIAGMTARLVAPRWINLEYLSAEDWVLGCHGLPSPHPPLLKYFFFPGFMPGTGGLLLEEGLPARRAAFQADAPAQDVFWAGLGLLPKVPGELRLSLFSYANAALPDLLAAWSAAENPVSCLVPEGTAVAALMEAEFGRAAVAGTDFRRGSLTLFVLPFLEQPEYDRLLWASDLNFVRGEDSFVRAQWAARPFVWHIYPQDDDAHHGKLEAFLKLYGAGLPPSTVVALRDFWHVWNGLAPADISAWRRFQAEMSALTAWGPAWAGRLADLGGLVANLENFVNSGL